jgi:site-specific recombinase XerD
MIERAGLEAKLGFKAHPDMLRHACGYALANGGHDTRALQAYLGHRNIQHTVQYTELSPTRFKGLLANLTCSRTCLGDINTISFNDLVGGGEQNGWHREA